MIYDEQVDRFLSSVPISNPNAKTKTQKLLVLLKHPDTMIRENSLMCFTSALCQAKNRDAGREEGLIPLFLDFLKRPPGPLYQKQSSYIIQSLSYNDANKDAIRDANGIPIIVSTLDHQKLANQEISMNCINSLLLLLSNATNREIIAETENIKVFIGCLGEGTSMQVQEKTLSLLHNLTVAKIGKNSLREGGALPFMAMFMESQKPNIRDMAIKTLYNLTGIPENRQEIRAHLLPSLLQILDQPLPQNEAIVLIALKILANVAFDRNAKDVIPKKEWFPHLVKILSSDNVNCITQALVCIQNLLNDETAVDGLFRAGGLMAVYDIGQRYQAQIPLLQKIILILAEMLAIDETHKPFVEASGLDFLLPLLSSSGDLDVQRAALRAISNLSIYYDEIRRQLCERGCANIVIDLLLHSNDRETLRRASMAMVNLALNYNNELLVFKSGILQKLLSQLTDGADKELTILASKILVNLTTNERIRKYVSEGGGIAASLDMLASTDEDYKLQGAKLVTNLAISGSNRKAMHDRGFVADLRKLSKRVMESPSLKTQIEIALDNCAFPYEHRYEDLDFVMEENMPPMAQEEEDEEDEEQRKERIQLEEEEHNWKVQEEKDNLARQLKEIELEKQAIAQREEEERQRQEQLRAEEEKRRQEEAEDERKRKEAEKKREEEERIRAETLRRRRTDTERLKLMEEEVKKREFEVNKKHFEDKVAREEREKKEREEREKREFDLKHRAEKRTKLIHDILQVERNYVNVLNLVIKKYLNPLQSSAKSQRPILSNDKIKTIFSIVEVIFNYHQLLLETLESRFKRWIADQMTQPLIIGDIFVRMTDYMACYSSYINNYNSSLQTINESRKANPGFLQFLKRVESDPEVRNQELESFIITPVQQLPRYVMLLNDLLRNTPIEHADYGALSSAVEKFRKLTSFVNEQKREAEDAAAIVHIQTNMRGKFPSLLVPYRKFIKEGFLNFGENGNIRSKEGYTFLFNDLLVFTIKSTSKLEYTYKEELKLDPSVHFKLENLKDDAKYKNGFLLKGTKSYTLLARTPVDKIAWMDAIKGAMANIHKR